MAGNILSANHSNILIDGNPIAGLQAISFKTNVNSEEIFAIGQDERVDVSFGKKTVTGTLVVKSYDANLDKLFADKKSFQIVAKLKKQKGLKEGARTVNFDEAFIEGKDFELNVSGSAQITYHFKATRIREE